MEELFQELERAKKKEEEEIKNIKYVFNKNKNKKQEPHFKKLVYEIRSKDEMYEEMKKKFRLQWKGIKILFFGKMSHFFRNWLF